MPNIFLTLFFFVWYVFALSVRLSEDPCPCVSDGPDPAGFCPLWVFFSLSPLSLFQIQRSPRPSRHVQREFGNRRSRRSSSSFSSRLHRHVDTARVHDCMWWAGAARKQLPTNQPRSSTRADLVKQVSLPLMHEMRRHQMQTPSAESPTLLFFKACFSICTCCYRLGLPRSRTCTKTYVPHTLLREQVLRWRRRMAHQIYDNMEDKKDREINSLTMTLHGSQLV